MTRRTIALLVALAGLAERTADRRFAVRFLVLLALRYAETVAREYVAGATLADGLWFDDGMEDATGPLAALLLAQRFRLLAEELVRLLPAAGRPDARDGRSRGLRRASRAVESRATPGALAAGPFDTS